MGIVYLGIFSSVFEWVYDKILSPVVDFISSLLKTTLTWLFEEILQPLLENVFWPIFESIVELALELIGTFLYSVLITMFQIIDALQACFDIFAGLQDVSLGDTTGSLLEVMVSTSTVQTAVWTFVGIGVFLSIFFSILAIIRSMGDLSEQPRPVSRVLSMAGESMLTLFLLPAAVLMILTLSSTLLKQVDEAISPEASSLTSMIFIISSLDAADDENYNVSSTTTTVDIGSYDSLRYPYYSGTKDYTNIIQVAQDFTLYRFDYFLGYGGCIFLLVILIIAAFGFIQRIFEIVLLFLVAPFFAAAIPLDDGEKMNTWKGLFLGKVFGGYGLVVGMKLYLIMAPIIMDQNIQFGDGSAEADYLLRFIFLLGGAWAIIKSGPLVTQIINAQAADAERESQNTLKDWTKNTYQWGKNAKNKMEQYSQRAMQQAQQSQAGSQPDTGGGAFGQPPNTAGPNGVGPNVGGPNGGGQMGGSGGQFTRSAPQQRAMAGGGISPAGSVPVGGSTPQGVMQPQGGVTPPVSGVAPQGGIAPKPSVGGVPTPVSGVAPQGSGVKPQGGVAPQANVTTPAPTPTPSYNGGTYTAPTPSAPTTPVSTPSYGAPSYSTPS